MEGGDKVANQEIRTLWEGYLLHVEGLNPILEKMSERGIPVNLEALKAFGKEVDKLKDDAYARLCSIYPLELLPAKQKEGLKKEPKEVIEIIESLYEEGEPPRKESLDERVWNRLGYLRKEFDAYLEIEEEYNEPCTCKKGKTIATFYDPLVSKGEQFLADIESGSGGCKNCNVNAGGFRSGWRTKRKVIGALRGKALRWYKPLPFKPSIQQISAYIKFKGYKAQTRATKKAEVRGKEAITTDKTALLQLFRQTKDEFFDLVVKFRNYDKLKGTYVKGWWPKGDGRVHSSYLFRPASGQLSSVNPNVQNSPGEKGGELSVKFKNCIEARDGRVLLSLDWSGLHAYMLGFLANDPSYMRLSRLGIHDFLAAHILKNMIEKEGVEKAAIGYTRLVDPKNPEPNVELMDQTSRHLQGLDLWLEMDDEALAVRLNLIKKLHKVFRNKIKPAVHGYGFGLGAFKLAKCVAPETKVLTWDLRWKPAGELLIGETLVGFDEMSSGQGRGRYLRPSRILDLQTQREPCFEVVTTRGTVRCSRNHLWLAKRNAKGGGPYEWLSSEQLLPLSRIAFMCAPWEVDESRDGGWLAGFLDGEGTVTGHSEILFSQNHGPLQDHAIYLFTEKGLTVSRDYKGGDRAGTFMVGSGMAFGGLRVAGMLRPHRLLPKVLSQLEGKRSWGNLSSPAVVLEVRDIGEQTVIAFGTQTRTFIAEGMLSHNSYPDNFSSVKEAKVPLDMLNETFPKVAAFREEIKRKAQEQGFLISPFGFIRHFNNVYDIRPVKDDYEPKWGERLLTRNGRLYKECSGLDAEKAIAYLPANCSFGYVRDAMLEVARLELDEEFCLINQIHDSLEFEPLEEEVEECIERVLEVMQAANPCLVSPLAPEGLRCFASVSVGKKWGEMKEL